MLLTEWEGSADFSSKTLLDSLRSSKVIFYVTANITDLIHVKKRFSKVQKTTMFILQNYKVIMFCAFNTFDVENV